MRLIPVVDLKGEKVVRAIAGARSRYKVLHSPHSEQPTLRSVAGSLVRLFEASVLYVADLDAIEGVGTHASELVEFCVSHPELEVWVDSGISRISKLSAYPGVNNIKHVIGTETLRCLADLDQNVANQRENYVLSLDFRNGAVLGPVPVLDHSELWPGQVIVMTLDAVGKQEGPDFDTVSSVIKLAQNRQVYAAGGVRDIKDLEQLAGMGVTGALVSSALHSGQIKTSDLKEIAGL